MTAKQLETYLQLHEQKIESFVKSKSRNWLIAGGLALVLFIVLVVVVFRHQKPAGENYEQQINTLDSLMKYQKVHVEDLEKRNVEQDSVIARLNEAYKNNRPIETRIINHYEKIPVDINSLDREQVRKQVSEY
jgi:hypothetical protein